MKKKKCLIFSCYYFFCISFNSLQTLSHFCNLLLIWYFSGNFFKFYVGYNTELTFKIYYVIRCYLFYDTYFGTNTLKFKLETVIWTNCTHSPKEWKIIGMWVILNYNYSCIFSYSLRRFDDLIVLLGIYSF